MAKFIVRVELHDSGAYSELHKAMAGAGFKREIDSGGSTYQLPTAEYFAEVSGTTTRQILSTALSAARLVDKDCAVLVARARRVRFAGLRKK